MAGRRTASKAVAAPVEPEVIEQDIIEEDGVEVEQVEDGDIPDTGESTEEIASTEGTESDEKPAEVVVDISSFVTVLDGALEKMDESTGVLDEKSVSDVLASYRDLDGAKNKARARKHVEEAMKSAVEKSDINSARALMGLSAQLTSPAKASKADGTGRTTKTPVNPTEAFVDTAVRLKLAMQIHSDRLADEEFAKSIDANWKELVSAKAAELANQLDTWATFLDSEDTDLDEPEGVDTVVKQAFKTVEGRSIGAVRSGGRQTQAAGDGIRRDIAKHLASAFAEVEEGGFLTIAQIRAHKSDEYGENSPSAGAITARLFPTDTDGKIKPTTVTGLVGATDDAGHKGARKVAA